MSKQTKRCALYTRKSTDEGLDQAFNSLDAQREACSAFVKSQASERWREIKTRYDDGGWSGGTLERPALQRLIADVEAGKIDVVVVYKIDRLSRSLADFVRLVETFDRCDVTFVSVTQAFNTTTSMGRLTLNILLSFAQFEREMTGERIRDKIAASKAKGLWVGGSPPLGYDPPGPGERILRVNEAEAETLRSIFRDYLALGSVNDLRRHLARRGVCSKRRTTRNGREVGGVPFSRGALFHLLSNEIYRGRIVHKGEVHEGLHRAIVDDELFAAVQKKLRQGSRKRPRRQRNVASSTLTGRIFDADGAPMTPAFGYGKQGKIYRYYVSSPLHQNGRADRPDAGGDAGAIRRVPAPAIEGFVQDAVGRFADRDDLGAAIRIEVRKRTVELLLASRCLPIAATRLGENEHAALDANDPELLRIVLPVRMRPRGGRTVIENVSAAPAAMLDRKLVQALKKAHAMLERGNDRKAVLNEAPASAYQRRLIHLAFLAPELQRAILDGRQPSGLTLSKLLSSRPPASWAKQIELYGAPLE
ncbi:MAG: hypothetical protein GC152_14905 [Alphaproteobacteria bacterium]|nr:hypothetical protein [Alphaproteobacteria bacterium]